MRIDVRVRNALEVIGEDAHVAEELGADGILNAEIEEDPFPGLALAAARTDRVGLGPAVAVAFARTPMTVAYPAYHLQRFSKGRFILGLGSQIRAHVERRYGMPWGHPAARMKEFVSALRAIWHTWDTGESLDFRGEFYQHTLMAPMMSPTRNPYGPPKVFLAGVGPRMLQVAGEVADGLFPHAFTTERYLREVVVPAVRAGQEAAGRPADAVEIAVSTLIATDDAEFEASRAQIAFYASTLAYRPVLELHGWGALQDELHPLSKQGRWDEMTALVPDEVVRTMSVVGSTAEVAKGLRSRFDGLADRLNFYIPGDVPPPTRYADLIAELHA
ncbi:TIGR03617 family F420-dependent LLM class oxidoreductase [Amycolatopsis pithecellobii]|uniref:TIGR03617 family F420-dependent LLM class oxidoreductase n=1 Tax=Amycolatopsis pithecellobii TaxID=664692 RepID=A0A6N7Z4Y6_9PSEU|nr:TIGR03617 family F420-dependent LLM class oxidoreductase [Amycolatopsis pithecellobii]MTD55470.1 TIGR03617 family F420-dependent LLM class oxidoreductase [Amycolatopsis pithecellobii]